MYKLNLPNTQWVTLATNALFAAAGAALTYIVQNVTSTDFGSYGPIVVALLTVLSNYVHSVVTNPTPTGDA